MEWESRFHDAGRLKTIIAGALVGLIFMSPALIGYGLVGLAGGFLAYFPIHAWLTVSLFLVLFSTHERERLLGGGYSAVGGFFVRLFGPFGLFCVGWFYTLLGTAFLAGLMD
jgi:hypothetical protein